MTAAMAAMADTALRISAISVAISIVATPAATHESIAHLPDQVNDRPYS